MVNKFWVARMHMNKVNIHVTDVWRIVMKEFFGSSSILQLSKKKFAQAGASIWVIVFSCLRAIGGSKKIDTQPRRGREK